MLDLIWIFFVYQSTKLILFRRCFSKQLQYRSNRKLIPYIKVYNKNIIKKETKLVLKMTAILLKLKHLVLKEPKKFAD